MSVMHGVCWFGFAIQRTTGRITIALRDADQAMMAPMAEMQQRGEVLEVQRAMVQRVARPGTIAAVERAAGIEP